MNGSKDLFFHIALKIKDHADLYNFALCNKTTSNTLEEQYYWRSRFVMYYAEYSKRLPNMCESLNTGVDFLELYKIMAKVPYTQQGIDWCAKHDNMYLYDYLYDKGIRPSSLGLEFLLENGHLEKFMWATGMFGNVSTGPNQGGPAAASLNLSFTPALGVLIKVVKNGHLNIIKAFNENILILGLTSNNYIRSYLRLLIDAAVINHQLVILDYLMDTFHEVPTFKYIVNSISGTGAPAGISVAVSDDIIKFIFLHKNPQYPIKDLKDKQRQTLINAIANKGNLSLLDFFIQLDSSLFGMMPTEFDEIIARGYLSILDRYHIEVKDKITPHNIELAAIYGNLDMVKMGMHVLRSMPFDFAFAFALVQKIIDYSGSAVVAKDSKGVLDVLNYLYLDLKIIPTGTIYAHDKCIIHKRLDLLEWLHNNNLIRLNSNSLYLALNSKNQKIIDFVLTVGADNSSKPESVIDNRTADINNARSVIDVYTMNYCCKKGNLYMLQRLMYKASGVLPNNDGVKSAATFNRINILRYLRDTLSIVVTVEMLSFTGRRTLLWLKDNKKVYIGPMKKGIDKALLTAKDLEYALLDF